MADGKHQNPVPPAVIAIESDISRFAARYHELAEIGFGGSAHQGMPLEYRDRVEDEVDRLRRGAGIGSGQKVAESFQIGERPRRVADARHRPALPPRRFRALRFPSCDASVEVTVHLAGRVGPAGTLDLLLRGERVGDKNPALFGESGMRFERLHHPGVRRLARGPRQGGNALFESLGKLQRRGSELAHEEVMEELEGKTSGRILPCALKASVQAIAASTRPGRKGVWRTRAPLAAKTALAMAGATTGVAIWPAPVGRFGVDISLM